MRSRASPLSGRHFQNRRKRLDVKLRVDGRVPRPGHQRLRHVLAPERLEAQSTHADCAQVELDLHTPVDTLVQVDKDRAERAEQGASRRAVRWRWVRHRCDAWRQHRRRTDGRHRRVQQRGGAGRDSEVLNLPLDVELHVEQHQLIDMPTGLRNELLAKHRRVRRRRHRPRAGLVDCRLAALGPARRPHSRPRALAHHDHRLYPSPLPTRLPAASRRRARPPSPGQGHELWSLRTSSPSAGRCAVVYSPGRVRAAGLTGSSPRRCRKRADQVHHADDGLRGRRRPRGSEPARWLVDEGKKGSKEGRERAHQLERVARAPSAPCAAAWRRRASGAPPTTSGTMHTSHASRERMCTWWLTDEGGRTPRASGRATHSFSTASQFVGVARVLPGPRAQSPPTWSRGAAR